MSSESCPDLTVADAAPLPRTRGSQSGAESSPRPPRQRSISPAGAAPSGHVGDAGLAVAAGEPSVEDEPGGLPVRSLRPRRPSLGGGTPARERELGTQGRLTVRRLLEAALAEFDEKGFQAVRVDDVVRRAKTSHGTFYLYFSNKDDLFRTLLRDALHDMELITDDFPVVTSNEVGRAALRQWIERFSDTYFAHATVIRILSQADIVGEEVYGDGLRLLFRLSEVIAQGMTAAAGAHKPASPELTQHAELTALACLMMLERINYLMSVDVRLPRDEMADRLTAIIYAAFHAS
jgi:AcrR family transcriptional regulator